MTEVCVNAIVAIGARGEVGNNGLIPWANTPELAECMKRDLGWFAHMTSDSVLVVGYRTYQEMLAMGFQNKERRVHVWPGKDRSPLGPGRFLEELHKANPGKNIWICGGGKTFDAFAFFIDRWHISRIPYTGPADVFFDQQWLIGRTSNGA